MAAALAVPGTTRIRKRSFFFALTGDQREFLFPGGNRERLTLNTLSLGFGARDDVHVLEAEGANADGEKNVKMPVQTTAMLGVQPSLPAVTLTSTVLALPVTFRLRSGPGPLYVSGSHLAGVEDAAAPVMAAAKSLPTASEEPAAKRAGVSPAEPLVAQKQASVPPAEPLVAKVAQKQTSVSPAEPLVAKVEQKRAGVYLAEPQVAKVEQKRAGVYLAEPQVAKVEQKRAGAYLAEPLVAQNVTKPLSYPPSAAKPSALAVFVAKYGNRAGSTPSSSSPADTKALECMDPELRKYYEELKDVINKKLVESAKTKIMKMMGMGQRVSGVKLRFERFLEYFLHVTEPNMVAELWEWRQTLK